MSAELKPHVLSEVFPLDDALILRLAESMRERGWLAGSIIWLWENGVLDGRHRVAAALLAGIKIPTEAIRQFDADSTAEGSQDATRFTLAQNKERRQMSTGQLAALATDLAKLKPGRPPKTASRDAVLFTQQQVAKMLGIGRSSITRTERVKAADTELFEKIKTGELEPGRAERILRDRESAQRIAKRAAREAKVTSVPPPDVRLGPFQDVLADVRDIDLVFCDPPYPREFLPLWSDLSKWAASTLKPGHLLIAYSGHWHLGDVMRRLAEHLDYHWMVALETPGASSNVWMTPFMPGWKPLIVFSNGPIARHYVDASDDNPASRVYDLIRSDESVTGDQHKWQQSREPAEYIIERLTERGDLVCDPFLGSGTTAVAASSLLRRFIGAEVDPVAFDTACRRIAALS